MTPLETEADPNIRVGPLRWGRPPRPFCSASKFGLNRLKTVLTVQFEISSAGQMSN